MPTSDHFLTSIPNALAVEAAVLRVQPRNGSAYDMDTARRERERIAVNVHAGLPPLEGVG